MYNEEIEQRVIAETEHFRKTFLDGDFKKERSDNHGPYYRLESLKEDEEGFLEFFHSDLARKIFNQEERK